MLRLLRQRLTIGRKRKKYPCHGIFSGGGAQGHSQDKITPKRERLFGTAQTAGCIFTIVKKYKISEGYKHQT